MLLRHCCSCGRGFKEQTGRCVSCDGSIERVSLDAMSAIQSLPPQHPGSADVPLSERLPLPRLRTSSSLHRRRPVLQERVLPARGRVCRQQAPASPSPRPVPCRARKEIDRHWSVDNAPSQSQTAAAGVIRRRGTRETSTSTTSTASQASHWNWTTSSSTHQSPLTN